MLDTWIICVLWNEVAEAGRVSRQWQARIANLINICGVLLGHACSTFWGQMTAKDSSSQNAHWTLIMCFLDKLLFYILVFPFEIGIMRDSFSYGYCEDWKIYTVKITLEVARHI